MDTLVEVLIVAVGVPVTIWWLRSGLLPALIGLPHVLRAGLRRDPTWHDAARRLVRPLLVNAAVALAVTPVEMVAPETMRRLTTGPGFTLGAAMVFLAAVFLLMDEVTWQRARGHEASAAPAPPLPDATSAIARTTRRRSRPRMGNGRHRRDEAGAGAKARTLRLVWGGRGA